MPNWEPAADRGLWALSDPRLNNPSQNEKEELLWSEELGSICYSLSPSPTHLSHTRNITLSRIKCERLYFYKEVCSFVHWSSYIMFDYISACIWICMRLYNIFIFGAWGRFAPTCRDFEPELNLDNQRSGRYQHIKKIRNEKPKWIWKKKKKKQEQNKTNETRKEKRKMER